MMKQRFLELAEKYLAGTASESECHLMEFYLAALEHDGALDGNEQEEDLIKADIWANVRLQTIDEEAPVIQLPWYKRNVIRWGAIAASIAFLIALGLFIIDKQKGSEWAYVRKESKQLDSPAATKRHLINTTGEDENLRLPDGSWVVLTNNSEIIYTYPFESTRDVTVIGRADFRVAKDKTKPFTVLSGAVATTALGTQFTVIAYKKSSQITVRLHEGSVVIRPTQKEDRWMKKAIYLKPGYEFIYSSQALAKVRSFRTKNLVDSDDNDADHVTQDNPAIPQDRNGSWYMFNNQSLRQVLDQLAFMYDAKIVYNKKDVQKKYVVGRFNKTDSLDIVLRYIALANKLTVTKKENTYYITK